MSLERSLTHSPTRSLTHSLTRPPFHSPIHSLARSLTHSRTHARTQFYGEDFIHVGPTDGSGGPSGSVGARTVWDPYELLAEESRDGPRVPYYLSEGYLSQADEAPPLGATTGDQQR